ncbi:MULTISPECIES: IS3 family transposase [unclassified Pasteurella]|uniref:IS3 family transposase n=1 Tax=unclassified Pasteurella TaxID=2621516 RepID=UPI00107348C2|nr:IS3 family transposase [Pasteurella sp. 19428wF3_WM03]TFU52977.1 hypothetical protein E4T92_00820 [Pasteurella sp. WM03]
MGRCSPCEGAATGIRTKWLNRLSMVLKRQGADIVQYKVHNLMQQIGLKTRYPKAKYPCQQAVGLVENIARDIVVVSPNQVWSGKCTDNAITERFFRSLKSERLFGYHFETRIQAMLCVAEYIEDFYNPRLLHSVLGYQSPIQLELG